jgi:hypothetical protein
MSIADLRKHFRRTAALSSLVLAPAAQAYTGLDEQTPGTLALQFRKQSNAWARVDSGFVDGKVETSPPETIKFDRRLETLVTTGFDAFFKRFGVRGNLKVDYVRRRMEDEEEPKAVDDEETTTYQPSVDFTFVTDKGLELFVGVQASYMPGYTHTTDTPTADSRTEYGKSLLQAPRLGVTRRANVWSGGFYYVAGDDSTRSYETTASDDTTVSGDEQIFEPPKVGVAGEVEAGSNTYDFELLFIQARGKGPKDDSNNTLYTDHFEVRLNALVGIGSGFNLKAGAAHRTLAYANNANVNLDTIPVTTLRTGVVLGSVESHGFFGLAYSIGRDGQSLPEFNADYQLDAYAFSAGFLLAL